MSEYGGSIWKRYVPNMISVSVIIIGLMVFFAIIEFKLNSIDVPKKSSVIEVEGFVNSNNDNDKYSSFCKTHEGDRNKLQTSCSKLTKSNCLATSCCVYADMDGKEQCHSGDINGPTFKRDENGKTKPIKYYEFRNNCFGDCK